MNFNENATLQELKELTKESHAQYVEALGKSRVHVDILNHVAFLCDYIHALESKIAESEVTE